ncbi:hypothetical protein U8607_02370 [Methylobacterium durans]|uniref:hypothetical protein n=1 Tax=Methylobacterium durans TaxID=2202825 RepID=UPI002B0017D9|nr:hypothetical protein [Methylobacterium durans]MEA1830915.1 hypothetical protein [Methylobacterium durans]
MGDEDLERPALLTLWPHALDVKAVEPREVASLKEALREAFAALHADSGAPWITTQSGHILSPSVLAGLWASEPLAGSAILAAPADPLPCDRTDRSPAALSHGARTTDRRPKTPSRARCLTARASMEGRRPDAQGSGRAGSRPIRPA